MYFNEETKKKKRGISPRDGFPLWAEEFWSCNRQPRKDEEARVENETKSVCVLLNVAADAVQKDGIVYALLNICEASGERRGTGKRRCGAERGRGNQALVQTLDLLGSFTRYNYIVYVDVAVVRNEKRERLHIQ